MKETFEDRLLNSNININNTISKKYSNSDLKEINSFDGKMTELDKNFNIEFLKRKFNDNYVVYFLGDESILEICYDKNYNKVYSYIYDLTYNSNELFLIKVGDDYSKLKNMFPIGDYRAMFVSSNQIKPQVKFYTKDGYVVKFYIDQTKVISFDISIL